MGFANTLTFAFIFLACHPYIFLLFFIFAIGMCTDWEGFSLPPTAVLGGLLIVTASAMSHAVVSVPGTEWVEPVYLWVSIGMPTGSGKSILVKYLITLLEKAGRQCGLNETSPVRELWMERTGLCLLFAFVYVIFCYVCLCACLVWPK